MTNKQAFITAVESEDTGTVKELLASDQTLAAHIDAPWFSFDALRLCLRLHPGTVNLSRF